MKVFSTILLLFISFISLFSQDIVKEAKVNFKDKTVIQGDFYYYPLESNIVEIIDSTGIKREFQLSAIDFVKGRTSILRNIPYKGEYKLFECIVEGDKLNLYKTEDNGDLQFYAFKDNQLYWLECGKKEILIDSKRYNQKIVTYIGVLKVLMNDNADLSKKIDQINCSEREISDLIIAYNEGHISYFKVKEVDHLFRKSDWKIYANYSNYKNFSGNPIVNFNQTVGSFVQIGSEYFPFEGSRYSFKFGMEYGKFTDKNPYDNVYQNNAKYLNFNVGYYYDFRRMPNANLYMGVRLVDIGWAWNDNNGALILVPRLSPCFGYEYHLSKHVDVFGELNHILRIDHMLSNFTLGITCDI